jgi:hypothetical protein
MKRYYSSVSEKLESGKMLWDVIHDSKQCMQSKEKNNGVTYVIIGSSGCGKTTMISEVLLKKVYGSMADKEYIITVFTESEHSDALDELDKKILIDPAGFDSQMFAWFYQTNTDFDKAYNFVAMLDDCIHIKHNKELEKMFLIYRNTNITSLVSLQYPNLIPKPVRTSVYYAFCFCMNNDEGIEVILEAYLRCYLPGKNKAEKILSYRRWTNGHRFFLVDNLEKRCYKVDEDYKCEEIPLLSALASEEEEEEVEVEEVGSD